MGRIFLSILWLFVKAVASGLLGLAISTVLIDANILSNSRILFSIVVFTLIAFTIIHNVAPANLTFDSRCISLLDFLQKAEKAGWRFFSHNSLLRDMEVGLFQAAIDNKIIFYGRYQNSSTSHTGKEPLKKISRAKLRDKHLSIPNPISQLIGDKYVTGWDISKSKYRIEDSMGNEVFNDIHLHNLQAYIWFKSSAHLCIGKGISSAKVKQTGSE